MSNRFHNKWHRHNHHTDPTAGEPDSRRDPIASPEDPFQGDFVINGNLTAVDAYFTALTALSATVYYQDIYVTELSGFHAIGSDSSLTIPDSIIAGQNNITLDGLGISGNRWATFDGDLQTKGDLWVSGTAYLPSIVVSVTGTTFEDCIDVDCINANSASEVTFNDNVLVPGLTATECIHADCVVATYDPPILSEFELVSSTNTPPAGWTDLPAEFSSMAYHPASGTIMACHSPGSSPPTTIYEITENADFVRRIPTDITDVEAICWVSGNRFAAIEERLVPSVAEPTYANMYLFDVDASTIAIAKAGEQYAQVTMDYVENRGPEGITYDAARNKFYIVREGTSTAGESFDPGNKRSIGVFEIDFSGSSPYAATELFSAVHMLSSILAPAGDLSDVYYDSEGDTLFIGSDTLSGIIQTDMNGNILDFVSGLNFHQLEAITFDTDMSDMFVGGEPFEFARYSRDPLLHIYGDTQIHGDLIADNISTTNNINMNCNNINNLAGISACNELLSITGDINMNGYSISGIGYDSLAFESGAKYGSDINGNIIIRPNTQSGSLTFGLSAEAATHAIALGRMAKAGSACVSIGNAPSAKAVWAVAIGTGPVADTASVAIGYQATATPGIAIGNNSRTTAGIAIGPESTAPAASSLSIGFGASAIQPQSISIGNHSIARGIRSIAIGDSASISGLGSVSDDIAIGPNAFVHSLLGETIALGQSAIALYEGTSVGGTAYSHAGTSFGQNASSHTGGVAVGMNTIASKNSIAIGLNATSISGWGVAIGRDSESTDTGISLGWMTSAAALGTVAIAPGAAATVLGAVQVGSGINSTENSLQFQDVPIVSGGCIRSESICGGPANNWSNTFTIVQSNSAGWDNHFDSTAIAAASAGWDSTETTVATNSAGWDNHFDSTAIAAASGNWNNTFTTVQSESGGWGVTVTDAITSDGIIYDSAVQDITSTGLFLSIGVQGSAFAIPLYYGV